jgi:hypothetical protein
MTDDATKTHLLRFFEEETTAGAMTVLSFWIRTYGIPQARYGDRKNAFVLTREPTDEELLRRITKPEGRFEKACRKLGIEVIARRSNSLSLPLPDMDSSVGR